MSFKNILINFICGFFVGGGAIMPGFSGGVLCVVFGVYQTVMELFSHPFRTIKRHWKMLLPIGIGWLVGFIIFANLIKLAFAGSDLFSTWAFIGLILGEVPALFKEAGSKGRKRADWIAAVIAGLTVFSILFGVKFLVHEHFALNIWWSLFGGFMWGLSIVIPGMTSTSIMLSLGFYEEFNAGLATLNPSVVIPWVLGMAITAAVLAQIISRLFEKYYSICYHCVVGITFASTLAVIPLPNEADYNLVRILICALICIVGFVLALLSDKLKVISDYKEEDKK